VSAAIARLIYRFRIVLTAVIVLGALALAPRADITHIDNELTGWFERTDPLYQQYEKFRDEFGGTRNLIVALQAPSRERLLSREGFDALAAMTLDIERVQTVEHVSSLATATAIDARPATSPDEDSVLDVRPLLDDLASQPADEVARRAIDDELLRGHLISASGQTLAIVVFFDERRVDGCGGRCWMRSARRSTDICQTVSSRITTAASRSAKSTPA
jgi:hypothetical protein